MNPPSQLTFRQLVSGLREGDEHAARHIVEHFTEPLVAVARRQIGARLRRRVDPEDIVQSTYRSLFGRMRDGQYQLGNGQDLWKLLVTLTLNKVRRKAKFHSAARRSVLVEQSHLPDLQSAETNLTEPSAEDAAELLDLLQQFIASIPVRERAILELRLQGYASSEIAEKTGRAQRTVRRTLQQLRERLQDWLKD
jgi:RNA polymerase sigma-70 factor (ECF subfamily)